MERISSILSSLNIRSTSVREDVLQFLYQHNVAITHQDLESALGQKYDRVTLYRTLNLFEEKGIIHKVTIDEGATRFAICTSGCESKHHNDHHPHFVCSQCGNLSCLEKMPIPSIKMPEGFILQEVEMKVTGLCNVCSIPSYPLGALDK